MKRYQCAVVGVGFVGAVHIEAVRRLGNVDVVAVCNRHGARQKADALCVPNAYDDYKAMLDAHKDLDVVHICTSDESHYEIAKEALNRGIHVLCEKPFTLSVEQAQELAALARQSGLRNGVCFHHRMYPMLCAMREYIASGKLGNVSAVFGNYLQDWMLYDTDYSWRLEEGRSGKTRIIADVGTHWFDTVEYVTGHQITEVMAQCLTMYPVRKRAVEKREAFAKASADAVYEEVENHLEDTATVLIRLDNGAIGTCVLSQSFAGLKNAVKVCVSGDESLVSWDTEAMCELFIGNRDRANEVLTKTPALLPSAAASLASYPGGHDEGYPDGFKQLFRQFYDSIDHDGAYCYATFTDGLHSTKITEAIYQSIVKKTWISV